MSDIRYNGWLHRSGTGGVWQDSSGRVGIGTSVGMNCLINSGPNSLTFGTGATPAERVRITSAGNLLVGKNSVYGSGIAQVHNTSQYCIDVATWAADATGPTVDFYKSRNATPGSSTIVQSGDVVGRLRFLGNDGTNSRTAAQITAESDGTPGTNDMPGRIVFATTADGASSSTERLRITSTGQIYVGGNTTYNESTSLISFATDASAGANMLSDSSAIYNHNNPAFLHIQNRYNTGTGQEAGIILHSKSSYNGTWAMYSKRTSSNYLADLLFRNRTDANASAERLRITSAGSVGINETSPDCKLHVNSGAADDCLKLESTDASVNLILRDSVCTSLIQQNNTTLMIGSDSANTTGGSIIAFYVDGTEQVRVADGIAFNGDTGSANFLNDYEEGVYTATLTCITSGTITVSSSWDQLYYTKIGRVVYITGRIRMSAVSSPSGAQLRLNLPIVSASGTEDGGRVNGFVYVQGATKDIQDYASMPTQGGNTYIQIGFADTTNSVTDVCATIDADTLIAVNFHYITS